MGLPAGKPIMILVADKDGRVGYKVWRAVQDDRFDSYTGPTTYWHVEIRSKRHAQRVAAEEGFNLRSEGEIWDRLPEED
ncbi:hypothetical protein H1V43_36625 [Streptomyces sp. PSKA54]|uniref:Uncharacterized protein n=1 Tax=Streptomyces himalayensis subsp. aureolus TaxID=2758039 RepID=A0A7W2HKC1_9ACTN|nr:hypothetical protein [Streptomyces himalayensis]MBA4866729.1 hypothetical protein [Streptomyces himalayensis subsp. aureolus]